MTNKKEEGNKSNELIKYEGKDLTIKFPEKARIDKKQKESREKLIVNNAIADYKNKTFVGNPAVRNLLSTDDAGATKFIVETDDEEKLEVGEKKYTSTRAIKDELAKRMEEPRSIDKQNEYEHANGALEALMLANELVIDRVTEAERLKKGEPGFMKKLKKELNVEVCDISGEKFTRENPAHGHHLERKSDVPSKILDEKNIKFVAAEIHKDIHKKGALGKDGYEQYKAQYQERKK